MEFLIFLAATVSRSSISHPPDHCWTLVTLVSLSAVFYNSTQVLCRSVLPFEVTDCHIGKGKIAGAVILVFWQDTQQKQKPLMRVSFPELSARRRLSPATRDRVCCPGETAQVRGGQPAPEIKHPCDMGNSLGMDPAFPRADQDAWFFPHSFGKSVRFL